MFKLEVQSRQPNQLINITADLKRLVRDYGNGFRACLIFVPHTTASVTINENADPDVVQDIIYGMNQLIPNVPAFKHMEGNSNAHIKSSLFGCSTTIPIEDGRLVLGTWQGVYFAEWDGPRHRHVVVQFL